MKDNKGILGKPVLIGIGSKGTEKYATGGIYTGNDLMNELDTHKEAIGAMVAEALNKLAPVCNKELREAIKFNREY